MRALITIILLFTSPAFAFYTVFETGDLLPIDQMQASTEVQFITSGDEGTNFIGRLDRGFDDESNLRFVAGAGTTDFQFGAFLKWVPYPDFDRQPAIGFTFGAHLAHFDSEGREESAGDGTEIALRANPFISKRFEYEQFAVSPYFSVPVAFSNFDGDTETPVLLVLGSRLKINDFEHAEFNLELGFDVNDAPSFVSIGAVFPTFDTWF